MTCQEHMKCPNCGVKLFLCECRGPHLEGSSAVQWDEGRLGHGQQICGCEVPQLLQHWAEGGEGDLLFCCFPQTVQQCPPCCGGDRELTAKVLPGVNHHRTPGMTLIGTDHCTACTVLYQWQTQSLQLDFLSLLTTDAPT